MSEADQPSRDGPREVMLLSCLQVTGHENILQETQKSILEATLEVWGKINFLIHVL